VCTHLRGVLKSETLLGETEICQAERIHLKITLS
jgi:hypothetical protein